MTAKAKPRTDPAERTLLNRELSHLEFHARVLELATDETLPLLERVKFCAIFSSNLDEFFQVRVAGLLGQAEAGRHGPLGRRADAAAGTRPDSRARAGAVRAPVAPLEARAPSCARRGGDHGRRHRGPRPEGAGEARAALRARDLPRSHTARGRTGPALPLHLGALALARDLRRGSRRRRGALRAREDPRRPSALLRPRRSRALRPARADHRPLPAVALPGRGDRRARGVPGDARRRLRGLRRRRRPPRGRRDPAAPPPLRRRRPRRGELVRVVRDGRAPAERPRSGRDADLSRREPARPLRAPRARSARPPRAEVRAVDPGDPAAARKRADRLPADLRRDPARRGPRAPAVRLVHRELRGVRAGGRPRSERHRDEDRGVPHERRQRARRVADPVRRGREAVGVPRRAQGALRRAPQHRVVESARAGGRPRRVRVPRPEDPREDDPHRPPRGRRAAPVRAHRHRATTTPRPRACTRISASSPPTRRSRPTSPTSSTTSPASAARRSSASSSSPRSRCAAGSSTRSARLPRLPRQGSTRASASSSTTSSTRRSSTSSTPPRRPAPGSTSSPARPARSGPASRASRRTSTSARSSGASSSTAASTPSRPTSASRRTSAAPISCSATSTTASRCSCPSRTLASGRGPRDPRQRARGRHERVDPRAVGRLGARACPRSRTRRTPITRR